jgi:guanosine-3',5'-bis(diphosphate) 3'-pyrophosphohydrolase
MHPSPKNEDRRKLGFECEKAIALLAKAMPATQVWDKPTLFHSIRVGTHLYEKGYPRDIVLAGFLHDLIEDSDISPNAIGKQFGKRIQTIVEANSKDPSIKNAHEKRKDMVVRCSKTGTDSFIVKIADVIDNFEYHSSLGDKDGLDYGIDMAALILEYKPNGFKDPILKEFLAYHRKFA